MSASLVVTESLIQVAHWVLLLYVRVILHPIKQVYSYAHGNQHTCT